MGSPGPVANGCPNPDRRSDPQHGATSCCRLRHLTTAERGWSTKGPPHRGQAKQSPLPAAVEATTRMTYRQSTSQRPAPSECWIVAFAIARPSGYAKTKAVVSSPGRTRLIWAIARATSYWARRDQDACFSAKRSPREGSRGPWRRPRRQRVRVRVLPRVSMRPHLVALALDLRRKPLVGRSRRRRLLSRDRTCQAQRPRDRRSDAAGPMQRPRTALSHLVGSRCGTRSGRTPGFGPVVARSLQAPRLRYRRDAGRDRATIVRPAFIGSRVRAQQRRGPGSASR